MDFDSDRGGWSKARAAQQLRLRRRRQRVARAPTRPGLLGPGGILSELTKSAQRAADPGAAPKRARDSASSDDDQSVDGATGPGKRARAHSGDAGDGAETANGAAVQENNAAMDDADAPAEEHRSPRAPDDAEAMLAADAAK